MFCFNLFDLIKCSFRSGIFTASSTTCDPKAVNHAVTIVGYGTSSGNPYWV